MRDEFVFKVFYLSENILGVWEIVRCGGILEVGIDYINFSVFFVVVFFILYVNLIFVLII